MMKGATIGPFLPILLLLAFKPGNSSTHSIGSHNTGSPTVDNIIEAVDHLTETFTWLQDNMLGSSFGEKVRNVENAISDLSSSLVENRTEILTGIYRSKDRVGYVKGVLKRAAYQLKTYCDELKDIINDNNVSNRLLKFTAKKMVNYFSSINDLLKHALNGVMEIKEEFSNTERLVQNLTATLNNSRQQVNRKIKENEDAIQQIIKNDLKLNDLHVHDLDPKLKVVDELKYRKEIIKDQTLSICTGTLGVICPVIVTKVSQINFPSGEVIINKCQNATTQSNGATVNGKAVANRQKVLPEQYADIANLQNILAEQSIAVNNLQHFTAEQAQLITKWQNMINEIYKITEIYKNVYDCLYLPDEQAVAFNNWQNLRSKFDNQNKLISDIEWQNELLVKIDRAHESTSVYLSQVDVIDNYIDRESDFMTKGYNSITSYVKNYENISDEAVESGLNAIKEKIIILGNYLNNFINQESV